MQIPYTIYFAGDLFDHKHLIGNAILASYIESCSGGRYRCIVPQDLEQPIGRGVGIRNNDLRMVMECDFGLFNFDGADLDSGTVVEFIYAKMLDIPSVLFRTDLRSRGDSGRDPWNLMCSYYPRTTTVQFNGMATYREIAQQTGIGAEPGTGAIAKTVEQLYTAIAQQLIDALDAAHQIPPLQIDSREEIEARYRWALRFPGSGLEALSQQNGYVEEIVRRKIEKGLL